MGNYGSKKDSDNTDKSSTLTAEASINVSGIATQLNTFSIVLVVIVIILLVFLLYYFYSSCKRKMNKWFTRRVQVLAQDQLTSGVQATSSQPQQIFLKV